MPRLFCYRWLRLADDERVRIVQQRQQAFPHRNAGRVPQRRAVPGGYNPDMHRSLHLLLPNRDTYANANTDDTWAGGNTLLPADGTPLLQGLLRLPTAAARLSSHMLSVHRVFADSDGNANRQRDTISIRDADVRQHSNLSALPGAGLLEAGCKRVPDGLRV